MLPLTNTVRVSLSSTEKVHPVEPLRPESLYQAVRRRPGVKEVEPFHVIPDGGTVEEMAVAAQASEEPVIDT